MRRLVYIYSREHGAWWRPEYCGYTDHKCKAGIFDYEDAKKHYPNIDYNKRKRDYFVDISVEEIESQINSFEEDIVELQDKISNLNDLLKELKNE